MDFPPYIHAEAERFNFMRATPISLLAVTHLIDALAACLTGHGVIAVPDEISAELATRVVADPNDREQRAILEALEDVAELERQYSQARDALIRIAMATPAPRDAILAASGLKSRSRLYQIAGESVAGTDSFYTPAAGDADQRNELGEPSGYVHRSAG